MNISKIRILLKVLFNPIWLLDILKFNKKVDVLFVCSEVDLSIREDKVRYSRYFEPIVQELKKNRKNIEFATWDKPKYKKDIVDYKWLGLMCITHWTSAIFLKNICKPEIIITIGGYNKFIESAKLNNIKVVELCHGFALDLDDYKWGISKYITPSPSAFVVYDDQTYETLLKNKYKNYDIRRCRHPSFNKLNENNKSIQNLEKNRIALVSLQHGYDGTRDFLKDILPNGIIHESLIEIIKTNKNFYWIIKMHPVQILGADRDLILKKLRKIFKDEVNVNFEDYNFTDVALILSRARLHITMMSGTIAESELFKVPSIGLCPTLKFGGVLSKAFDSARSNKLLYLSELKISDIQLLVDKIALEVDDYQIQVDDFIEAEEENRCASEYIINLISEKQNI